MAGGVEAVGVGVVGVAQAQLLRLVVHHLDEGLHAAGHALCQDHAGVVAGVDEQAAEQLVDCGLVALGQPGRRLSHARGGGRHGEDLVELGVFQRDDGGHDLGDGGHGALVVCLARPQDVAVCIDQHAVGGVDGGGLCNGEAAVCDGGAAHVVCAADVCQGGGGRAGDNQRERHDGAQQA